MNQAENLAKEQKARARTAINLLPQGAWDGQVFMVNTEREYMLQTAVEHLSRNSLLGFDTETRPAFHKGQKYPVSLLQLASEDVVFLFQLRQIGLPRELRELLANPKIIKVGVGLDHDVRMLRELGDFTPQGFVNLASVARRRGVNQSGLRGLAAALLELRISKSARTSNWDAPELSAKQIRYAATDAWISREIWLALQKLAPVQPEQSESPLHSHDA